MRWKGVTVSEQRENFPRDYNLCYYTVSDLVQRCSILMKIACKLDQPLQRARQGKPSGPIPQT